MSVVVVDGVKYAVGVEWRALTSEDEGHLQEAHRIAKEAGKKHFTMCNQEDPTAEDAVGLFPDGVPAGTKSLAAAVVASGKFPRNSAFIMPVPENEGFWFLSISGGLPDPNSDRIVETVEQCMESIASAFMFEEQQVPVYTPVHDKLNEGYTREHLALDDLVGSHKEAPKPIRTKGSPAMAAAVAGGIVVVGLLLAVMLWPSQPQRTLDPAQLQAKQLAIAKKRAEDAIAALVMEAKGAASRDWVTPVKELLWDIPMNLDGMTMKEAKCTNLPSCEIVYVNTGRMSLPAFRNRFSAVADDIVFSLDGKSATIFMGFTEKQIPLLIGDIRDDALTSADAIALLEAAPGQKAFGEELLVRLLKLEQAYPRGWSRTVQAARAARNVPLAGSPGSPLNDNVLVGTVDIALQDIWLVDTVLELLDSPYIFINSFEVTGVESGPRVKISATYFVLDKAGEAE